MSRCKTSLAWACSRATAACRASRATSRSNEDALVKDGLACRDLAGFDAIVGFGAVVLPQLV